MKQSIHSIIISFNYVASQLYTSILGQFSASIQLVTRRGNENVFMMQKGKYSDALKKDLETEAKKIIDTNPELREKLTAALSSRIRFYMQEFAQQCKGY